MAYDYLDDIWGKCRNRESRFSDLEEHALSLLGKFVSNNITCRDFAKDFDSIRIKFIELTEVDGQTCIDEDTPLWLNQLLGFHFVKWYRFQTVKWYFDEHPEELQGEYKEHYNDLLEQQIDLHFVETCKVVLRKLDKNNRKSGKDPISL